MLMDSPTKPLPHKRILIIDDNRAIHGDFRKILCPQAGSQAVAELDAAEAALFGDSPEADAPALPDLQACFQLDSAFQGEDGVALALAAEKAGQPYAMAFVDMRMPPGWDGMRTTEELWKISPALQVVICTAYSDYSWDELTRRLGQSDRLVILKKPFDTIEALQLANTLTEKWRLLAALHERMAGLEHAVQARTAEHEATNRQLRAEIAERRRVEADLEKARDLAVQADRAKSTFLANMSHEIRTPMNGVIGMVHLLLETPLTSEQIEYAQAIGQSGEILTHLINDILDFSKIEAGMLIIEHLDFDLPDAIEKVADLTAGQAAAKGIELIVEIDPALPRMVIGDPIRLRQILLNFLNNALKFTSHGEVILSAQLEEANDSGVPHIRFEITDTGIGIEPEVLPLLFQPFTQADSSTTRRFGGTGLGLAICKQIVRLLHGRIGACSTPGKGSTFWITIPLPLSTLPVPTPTDLTVLPRARVLIVDDHATNRKILDRQLTNWGMVHRDVASGPDALEELRRAAAIGQPYELVILDHQMPEMSGTQLSAEIRADPLIAGCRLLIFTSQGDRFSTSELRRHGLDACQLKPIHPSQLRSCIAGLFTPANAAPVPAPTQPNKAPTPGIKAPAARPLSILIAEDNAVNQKVALLQLRQLGYHADLASDGHEVLARLVGHRYDLILMDAQMPGLDGLDTTREIRRRQALGELPVPMCIIAMTANAMPGDREICIEAGMDDYLPKPVHPTDLRLIIERNFPAPSSLVNGSECTPPPPPSHT